MKFVKIFCFLFFCLSSIIFTEENPPNEDKNIKKSFLENWTNNKSFEKNIYIGGSIGWSHSHERASGSLGDFYAPDNFLPGIFFGIGFKPTKSFYLGADFSIDFTNYKYQNSPLDVKLPTKLENVFALRGIFGYNPPAWKLMPYIAVGFCSGTGHISNPGQNTYLSKQIFGLQGGIGLQFLPHKNMLVRIELSYDYFMFYDHQIAPNLFPHKKLQYIDVTSIKLGFAYKF